MNFNPPSLLETESMLFSSNGPQTQTNERISEDLFSDIDFHWLDMSTSTAQPPNQPPQSGGETVPQLQPLLTTPRVAPTGEQVAPTNTNPTPPSPQRTTPMYNFGLPLPRDALTVDDSTKKDIIKYLYNQGTCNYLRTCFRNVEDIDTMSEYNLHKKFKIGLVVDSLLGKNASEKNLANFIFSFFDILLSETSRFAPTDIQKYIDTFTTSLQKDKITILNESSTSTLASVLTSENVDDMIKNVVLKESPSFRALKSSLQNISLLVSLALTKKMFSPYLISLFEKPKHTNERERQEEDNPSKPLPPSKRLRTA